jgi:hypothetical protein
LQAGEQAVLVFFKPSWNRKQKRRLFSNQQMFVLVDYIDLCITGCGHMRMRAIKWFGTHADYCGLSGRIAVYSNRLIHVIKGVLWGG